MYYDIYLQKNTEKGLIQWSSMQFFFIFKVHSGAEINKR